MKTDADDTILVHPDEALAEAAALMLPHAIRVASRALALCVPGYRRQIQQAIDDEAAAITVQCDLPSGAIRVLIDGDGWPRPQCLLAIDPSGPVEVKHDA